VVAEAEAEAGRDNSSAKDSAAIKASAHHSLR
jgi:hypothetical protein